MNIFSSEMHQFELADPVQSVWNHSGTSEVLLFAIQQTGSSISKINLFSYFGSIIERMSASDNEIYINLIYP